MRSSLSLLGVAILLAAPGGLGVLAAQPASVSLRITQDNTRVSILAGERPLLDYRYADVPYKPYVEKFFTPTGINVLRDSPHDHKHHHALMFAVAAEGVDFWAEFPNRKHGSQVHRGLKVVTKAASPGVSRAALVEQLDWLSADKVPLLAEQRTITAHVAKDLDASLLTWQTQLQPAEGKDSVKLTGSHYFGLGMRFVQSMDRVGRFFNPTGKQGPIARGKERLTRAEWIAYVAPAGGKTVTVAVFDHPDNPRHPATMFTMLQHFAYISATLNLSKQPLVIEAGKPLALCYGVALWDGETSAEEVGKTYQRWVALQ